MYIYKAVGATSSEGFPVRRMIGAGAVSHRRGAVIAVCRGERCDRGLVYQPRPWCQ